MNSQTWCSIVKKHGELHGPCCIVFNNVCKAFRFMDIFLKCSSSVLEPSILAQHQTVTVFCCFGFGRF